MSSFTSVLKKIGQVIVSGAAIGTEIMGFPFVSQLLSGSPKTQTIANTVTSDLNVLAGIIASAEVMFPVTGSGPQRLAAITPLIQTALQSWATSNLPGKKPKDPALAVKGAGEVAAGLADFINSYGD